MTPTSAVALALTLVLGAELGCSGREQAALYGGPPPRADFELSERQKKARVLERLLEAKTPEEREALERELQRLSEPDIIPDAGGD